MKKVCSLLLLITLCLGLVEAAKPRVLFIGNSYTAPLRGTLTTLLDQSPHSNAELSFITKGGATLTQHLETEATIQTIQTGNWDFVVLQEQSQTPALGGQYTASFNKAVNELCEIIQDAGARPVLYITWGRRDGDARNPNLFPDFETMQGKLSKAYREAARKNDALLAPVGEVWSAVREKDPVLGKALYQKDGSHPSTKGTFLISCVFLKVLCDDPLANLTSKSVTQSEAEAITGAIDSRE